MCQVFSVLSQLKLFNRLHRLPFTRRKFAFSASLALCAATGQVILQPSAAHACFYWQECAQQRGQASNTRAGGKRTGLIQGGNDDTIPYVISPRNSWIGETRYPAHIHWNSVAGADRYTVRIWQWTYDRTSTDEIVWETTVNSADINDADVDSITTNSSDNTVLSKLSFPTDVSLSLGRYYSVEVVTEDGVSSNADQGYYQSGFQLLSAEDYESVQSHLDQIQVLSESDSAATATDEETQLAMAGSYFLDEMYADALLIIETLAENPAASYLVYAAMGDTYSATGLNQLALEAYERALSLAEANQKLRGQATVLSSMADIHIRTGQFEQAEERLLQARQTYGEIGAYPEISAIDQRIGLLASFQSRMP